MTRPTDEQLLAFLEGELGEAERADLLELLERDPDLARELRSAARGLAAMDSLSIPAAPADGAGVGGPGAGRFWPRWVAVAAVAATLLVSVPATLWFTSRGGRADSGVRVQALGVPAVDEPGFVLVLQGRWPDAGMLAPEEVQRRAAEYWAWADSLSQTPLFMAAGDLRWEPGRRLGPTGVPVSVAADVVESPDFMVGMFALRVSTYEEAMAIALGCPHLRYGGSVSVRQVARGFLTNQGSVERGS